MQQELRFATFNVCNLALPGVKFYDDQEPYTQAEYEAKLEWTAWLLDRLDADVIGLQEIFAPEALRAVLARTRGYRDAECLCYDPGSPARPTPRVALISRLPLAPGAVFHSALPRDQGFVVPGTSELQTSFTRRVLQVRVLPPGHTPIEVFVCHLKSKRPDFRNDANLPPSDQLGLALLRSLLRRGADAVGLRALVSACLAESGLPLVVMGDFNDSADSVATRIVLGAGQADADDPAFHLFDSSRIQTRRDPERDVGYTHLHDGRHETIDHILVSRDFHPECSDAIGEMLEVIYLNDHLALDSPLSSDHGAVMARIRLRDIFEAG